MNGTRWRRWLRAQAKRRSHIRALFAGGMRLSDIARRYRVSPARIHQIINARGNEP